MAKKMKGFAMLEIGKTGWIEKDYPTCGPLDAICRPLALAPCTSDVHTVWEGALGNRHDMILGHEGVGEIVEVGALVKDFKPGDKVLVPAITPDWNSLEAQAGFSMHSTGMNSGWKFSNFKDGVFGEYFHVNDADGNLALLPEGISPMEGAMLSDMVPTGFHGAELADVQYGDSVLVIGIGPVGLMSVAGAALREARSAARQTEGTGWSAFATIYGSTASLTTETDVTTRGLSLVTGLARHAETAWLDVLVGAFFEAGYGSLNTTREVTGTTIQGSGDTRYTGGGLLARIDLTQGLLRGFYVEGSGRAGEVPLGLLDGADGVVGDEKPAVGADRKRTTRHRLWTVVASQAFQHGGARVFLRLVHGDLPSVHPEYSTIGYGRAALKAGRARRMLSMGTAQQRRMWPTMPKPRPGTAMAPWRRRRWQ